jgi:alanine racemase
MAIADTRAWIEVDLDALRANYDTVRRAVGPGTAIVPMVKADAYGLGAARVVRALESREPVGVRCRHGGGGRGRPGAGR